MKPWGPLTQAALERDPTEPFTTCVYLIQARESGLVKIGLASKPLERLRHLRTGSPDHLGLVGLLAGDRGLERELHAEFSVDRVHGEWFKMSYRLARLVDAAHRAATGISIADRVPA